MKLKLIRTLINRKFSVQTMPTINPLRWQSSRIVAAMVKKRIETKKFQMSSQIIERLKVATNNISEETVENAVKLKLDGLWPY
jgi:hypothetical protein